MNPALESVIELLSGLKDIQEKTLELSYEKRQVILDGKVERLNEIVQMEMQFLSKIKSIEKKRLGSMNELSKEFSVPARDITVSMLIERTSGDDRRRLNTLHKEITGLLSAQAELNKINKQLLETHLDYADAMLGVLVGSEDPLNNFYGSDGRSADEDNKRSSMGLFDQQI